MYLLFSYTNLLIWSIWSPNEPLFRVAFPNVSNVWMTWSTFGCAAMVWSLPLRMRTMSKLRPTCIDFCPWMKVKKLINVALCIALSFMEMGELIRPKLFVNTAILSIIKLHWNKAFSLDVPSQMNILYQSGCIAMLNFVYFMSRKKFLQII